MATNPQEGGAVAFAAPVVLEAPPLLLETPDAARVLGVNVGQLEKWRKKGMIRPVKADEGERSIFYRYEDLVRFSRAMVGA